MDEQQLIEHSQYLLKVALKKTGNCELAEDIVSETVISALAAVKSSQNTGKQGGKMIENPRAWLLGIMNHKLNDFLRSKYAKPVISYGVIPQVDFKSHEESALEKLIKKEDGEHVRMVISQLAKNYREVLVRHYLYGQKLDEVAQKLELNVGTVKSRLNAARAKIKTEMEKNGMEKFEKQSYEPETLEIWMYGEKDVSCSAFYTNDRTRLLQQNILIMAYKKPLTVSELSKGLGISAAYIEPLIDELISYDFMARTGDKVYTSFLIFSEEEKFHTYDHDKAVAEKNAQKMWLVLENYLEKIRTQDFYKRMSARQKASLIQFAAIFMIHEATREIKDEKFAVPDVQDVRHECGWHGYAYGFSGAQDKEPDWDYATGHALCKMNGPHSVSTGPYKNMSDLHFYAYNVASGWTFGQWWPLDDLQFLKVVYALYAEEETDIPLIAPKFFDPEVMERLEQYNILEKTEDLGSANFDKEQPQSASPTANEPPHKKHCIEHLAIPVLTDEESRLLFEEIFHDGIIDFAKTFHSELEELLVNPVKVPAHLKGSVPSFLRYQLCADAFVMALVFQDAWNGWYKNELAAKNEQVPAMIICLGKEKAVANQQDFMIQLATPQNRSTPCQAHPLAPAKN